MKISEICLNLKKYQNCVVKGKPISVYTDGRYIYLASEQRNIYYEDEYEIFMFSNRTELADEDAKDLIFLGSVYLTEQYCAIHVYYRRAYTNKLEKIKTLDSDKDSAYANFNYNLYKKPTASESNKIECEPEYVH